jgi:hypothetical protein
MASVDSNTPLGIELVVRRLWLPCFGGVARDCYGGPSHDGYAAVCNMTEVYVVILLVRKEPIMVKLEALSYHFPARTN